MVERYVRDVEAASSNLVASMEVYITPLFYAVIAQSVVHYIGSVEVAGSIPANSFI